MRVRERVAAGMRHHRGDLLRWGIGGDALHSASARAPAEEDVHHLHHARTRRFATETFRKAAKFAIFEDSEVMIEDRSLRKELSNGIRKSIAQINGSQN